VAVRWADVTDNHDSSDVASEAKLATFTALQLLGGRLPKAKYGPDLLVFVEARRIELPNLLHAMQALYQLSYAPAGWHQRSKSDLPGPTPSRRDRTMSRCGWEERVGWALTFMGQPGGVTSSWIDALATVAVLENEPGRGRCWRRSTLLPS
jgi:hypothetical protein